MLRQVCLTLTPWALYTHVGCHFLAPGSSQPIPAPPRAKLQQGPLQAPTLPSPDSTRSRLQRSLSPPQTLAGRSLMVQAKILPVGSLLKAPPYGARSWPWFQSALGPTVRQEDRVANNKSKQQKNLPLLKTFSVWMLRWLPDVGGRVCPTKIHQLEIQYPTSQECANGIWR